MRIPLNPRFESRNVQTPLRKVRILAAAVAVAAGVIWNASEHNSSPWLTSLCVPGKLRSRSCRNGFCWSVNLPPACCIVKGDRITNSTNHRRPAKQDDGAWHKGTLPKRALYANGCTDFWTSGPQVRNLTLVRGSLTSAESGAMLMNAHEKV